MRGIGFYYGPSCHSENDGKEVFLQLEKAA